MQTAPWFLYANFWENIMAKDDYFVLVYKILAYLYTVLKEGRSPDAKMLQYDSTLLGVNEPYWAYIMENLQAQGYITGLRSKEHIKSGTMPNHAGRHCLPV